MEPPITPWKNDDISLKGKALSLVPLSPFMSTASQPRLMHLHRSYVKGGIPRQIPVGQVGRLGIANKCYFAISFWLQMSVTSHFSPSFPSTIIDEGYIVYDNGRAKPAQIWPDRIGPNVVNVVFLPRRYLQVLHTAPTDPATRHCPFCAYAFHPVFILRRHSAEPPPI
jgi:hypothetical protein